MLFTQLSLLAALDAHAVASEAACLLLANRRGGTVFVLLRDAATRVRLATPLSRAGVGILAVGIFDGHADAVVDVAATVALTENRLATTIEIRDTPLPLVHAGSVQ